MTNTFSKSQKIYVNNRKFSQINNQYTQFIDFFQAPPSQAEDTLFFDDNTKIIVNICADSDYALFINGTLVSFGNYPSTSQNLYFDTIDVTAYTMPAFRNKIAILAYHQGKETQTYTKGEPGIIFEILSQKQDSNENTVLCASSQDTISRIAPEYSQGNIPMVSPDTFYTFEYDALSYDNWEEYEYNLSSIARTGAKWAHSVITPETRQYVPRPLRKQSLTSALSAKIISCGIFDYGDEYRNTRTKTPADYMRLATIKPSVSTPTEKLAPISQAISNSFDDSSSSSVNLTYSGNETATTPSRSLSGKGIYAVVDLGQNECGYLSFDIEAPENTVITIGYDNTPTGVSPCEAMPSQNRSCSYICKGGREIFAHFLHRISGRYLRIYAECNNIIIHAVGILPTIYALSPSTEGTFQYTDALHSKIYSISLSTLKRSINRQYESVPVCKKNTSATSRNLRNDLLARYYALGDYTAANVLLEKCAATPMDTKASLLWVHAMSEYVLYSGDSAFCLKNISIAENFIQAAMESTDQLNTNAELSAFLIIALERLAQTYAFSECYDNLAKANHYMTLCETLRSAFNKTFFNEALCLYANQPITSANLTYSNFVNILAIYCGVCTEAHKITLAEKIALGKIEARDAFTDTYNLLYKYEALLLTDSKYIDFVMKDIEQYWGNMLFEGATDFDENFATPLIVYYKYVLGLRPTKPGFKDYVFSPRKYKCHEATGKIVTPSGTFNITASPADNLCNKL